MARGLPKKILTDEDIAPPTSERVAWLKSLAVAAVVTVKNLKGNDFTGIVTEVFDAEPEHNRPPRMFIKGNSDGQETWDVYCRDRGILWGGCIYHHRIEPHNGKPLGLLLNDPRHPERKAARARSLRGYWAKKRAEKLAKEKENDAPTDGPCVGDEGD